MALETAGEKPTLLIRSRPIGIPAGPVLIDVRPDHEFMVKPLLVPGTLRRSVADIAAWALSVTRARLAAASYAYGILRA